MQSGRQVLPADPLGLVHLYTGNGKGKTTAALGLAVRASGQGMRVCLLQFMKGRKRCGEHRFLDRWPGFKIIQPGSTSYFALSPPDRLAAARIAFSQASSLILAGEYDLIILDECLTAVKGGLLSLQEVLDLIASKPRRLELVLTGRGAPEALVRVADLVTEMVSVKHPLKQGIRARKGIEY